VLDEVWLYTDGAARPNPGPAAAGFRILTSSGELLFEHEESLGDRTNNHAEYAALISGLDACRAYTRNRVCVGSDSRLVVKQMAGEWRVKNPELKALQADARARAGVFREVQYRHYPRTHPEISAVDQALDRLLDLDARRGSSQAAV
jgi:ribonuclease HI